MGRISRQVMFMEMARVAAKRSTCHRLNVGAIITWDNRPISIGWNGQSPGAPHCTGNECPGVIPGNCGTTHAEINALNHAPQDWYKTSWDLYVTDSPCPNCANAVIDSPVKRVFYEKLYRITDGVDMLRSAFIEIYEVTPAGYVIEYFTRKVVELP